MDKLQSRHAEAFSDEHNSAWIATLWVTLLSLAVLAALTM